MRRINQWLIVAILIAGVMSGLAVWQAKNANQERNNAKSQTVVANEQKEKANKEEEKARVASAKAELP